MFKLPFIPTIPGLPKLGVQELPTAEVEELRTPESRKTSFSDAIPYVVAAGIFVFVVYIIAKKK